MPLARDDIESALLRKGFRQKQADHRKFHFWTTDGKKTAIFTKTSHGSKKYKTLSNDLVAAMARQLRITKKEFVSFVECEIGHDEYEALLAERNTL